MQQTSRLRAPADLGLVIQQARLAQGLTQRQLADRLGLAQRSVSEIESGRPTIYVRKVFELLRATGVELSAQWEDGTQREDGTQPDDGTQRDDRRER